MSYVKTQWEDQEGQVRYTITEDGEGSGIYILTPNYEEVDPVGTPVNADNLNHIEQGIADAFDYVDTKIAAMLGALYPVGSIYIGTQANCPLETLGIGTWALVSGGRVLQGADSSHAAGTTIAAGLPAINGAFRIGDNNDSNYWGRCWTASGAFSGTAEKHIFGNYDDGSTETAIGNVKFKASNSSTIYGNSNTVQPPAYCVNIWRRTA